MALPWNDKGIQWQWELSFSTMQLRSLGILGNLSSAFVTLTNWNKTLQKVFEGGFCKLHIIFKHLLCCWWPPTVIIFFNHLHRACNERKRFHMHGREWNTDPGEAVARLNILSPIYISVLSLIFWVVASFSSDSYCCHLSLLYSISSSTVAPLLILLLLLLSALLFCAWVKIIT